MYIYTEENSVVNRGSYCSFILLQLMEAMPTTNKENYTSTTITRQRLHHTSHAPDIRIPSGASIAAQGTRLRAYHVSFSHIHNNSYTVHIHHFSSFCSLFLLFHPAGSEHSDRYLCDGLVDLRCHACQHIVTIFDLFTARLAVIILTHPLQPFTHCVIIIGNNRRV